MAKTGKDAEATVAGLNRDTEHANDGAIGKIFDKQKVEEQQEIARLQAQVVQQAAPILYNKVGDFLQGKPDAVKVAVHALVGGLVSRALGGEFAAGAVGAGAAELAMVSFGKQLLAIDGLSDADRKALVQLVGMAVSGLAAGAAGGSTAGVAAAVGTAQTAVQNNFLNHVDREAYEKAKAACGPSNPKACAEAQIYAEHDKQNDKDLASAVNRCAPGEDCQGVSNNILSQMKAAGCGTAPSSVDCNKLSTAWLAAQSKAQGLETPLLSLDDLIPFKGITSVALLGVRGAGKMLAEAGLLGIVRRVEPEAVETIIKGGGQDIAKSYLSNNAAPATQQRLADAAKFARTELPANGNVAVAEVSIPALSTETSVMKAYSGYDEAIGSFLPKPSGDVDSWLLKPVKATAKYVGGDGAYLRDSDTEFKILETIAQRLGDKRSASGVINLLSEKSVCPSCTSVVMQFRSMFPNIQLNIFTK
ncbi:hemagglutinin [Ralstonia solanacearum]|nr:hemagglutinin [Ralstonia solanacearum]NKA86298.1 hemagglutinin [Ralstonia solanacearum]NKA96575.1 hemagglutinin [Ralstonia solanacearum]NKF57693.1 hemagglutinin [Ralstonia solanacearum]NKF62623.1 hemagglutinin [Ralstonia solanacearum]